MIIGDDNCWNQSLFWTNPSALSTYLTFMIREILEHKKFIPSRLPFRKADCHRIRTEWFFFFPPKKRAVKTHRLTYHSKILGEKSIVSKILCNRSYNKTLFGCYILQKEEKPIKMAWMINAFHTKPTISSEYIC